MSERDESRLNALIRENESLREQLRNAFDAIAEMHRRNRVACRCRCDCPCHGGQVAVMHFMACCQPCPLETERGT